MIIISLIILLTIILVLWGGITIFTFILLGLAKLIEKGNEKKARKEAINEDKQT